MRRRTRRGLSVSILDPQGTRWHVSAHREGIPAATAAKLGLPRLERSKDAADFSGCLWTLVTLRPSFLLAAVSARNPPGWVITATPDGHGTRARTWATTDRSRKEVARSVRRLAEHLASGRAPTEFGRAEQADQGPTALPAIDSSHARE